jgi:hypothetical protein
MKDDYICIDESEKRWINQWRFELTVNGDRFVLVDPKVSKKHKFIGGNLTVLICDAIDARKEFDKRVESDKKILEDNKNKKRKVSKISSDIGDTQFCVTPHKDEWMKLPKVKVVEKVLEDDIEAEHTHNDIVPIRIEATVVQSLENSSLGLDKVVDDFVHTAYLRGKEMKKKKKPRKSPFLQNQYTEAFFKGYDEG